MYEFRVTAISEEGESEPLVTDCAIKAKNPYGKKRTETKACFKEEEETRSGIKCLVASSEKNARLRKKERIWPL